MKRKKKREEDEEEERVKEKNIFDDYNRNKISNNNRPLNQLISFL